MKSGSGQILKEVAITPVGGTTWGAVIAQLNDPTTGAGSYGTFSMSAAGQLSFTPGAGYSNAIIVSTGDATTLGTTGVSMSEYFGLGERFQMEQAVGAKVVSRIASDSRYFGFAKLDLLPTTVVGDPVVTPADARGAVAFNNIQTSSFQIPAAGRIVAMTVTLAEYVATFLADTGQRAAEATTFAENNKALHAEVESRLANERGVSLDEELSNMMIYQQSYNAAARMVTTAKELYDTLLSIA